MLIYVVVAIFSTFMMKKYELTRRKIFIILSFLSVFLVMAFRYGIGYDYLNIYTPMFNNIINSRIKKVYIGANDDKSGAVGSILNLLEDYKFNHIVEVEKGILEEECKNILKDFFKYLREMKKQVK